MINILLPMGGKSPFFNSPEYLFPIPLIEICGRPIIEMVIDNLNNVDDEKHFIFVVSESDCMKYHIDSVLNLLTNNRCDIIRLIGATKGAACSALFAIELIDNDVPLVIANSDQVIDDDIGKIIEYFKKGNADAGVVCFESIHPRWSYVRIDMDGKVIETAEKRPLSKNAIAGFYYFKYGKDFVYAAMQSIKKDCHVNGQYYIAPTFNELILENKRPLIYKLDNSKYHTFFSPQKIKDYEQKMSK